MEEEIVRPEDQANLDDPRQKLMWEKYIKPTSATFADAKNSAIAAGYSESYAATITQKVWFKSKLRRMNMLPKAEKALTKALDISTVNDKGQEQADLLRVQVDAAKFVASRLGKDEGYSERTEMTGKNGDAIVFMPAELMDKYNLKNGNKEMDSEGN